MEKPNAATEAAPEIANESALLDELKRKELIASFHFAKAQQRKAEAFKAYECLKDKTINYVLDLLLRQFSTTTVQEMQYALSNVSILRKVIEKLAKVYANGVKRTMPDNEADTAAVEEAATLADLNNVMAKANRYFRVFKNTLVFPHPVECEDGKYELTVEVLPPFHYDVVENPANPKKPLAVVISDYAPNRETVYTLGDAAKAHGPAENSLIRKSTAVYQQDQDKSHYIWWSRNYHFTTDAMGKIVAPAAKADGTLETANPILRLPFVNICGDQDHGFWAEGGHDLVDAGIKINVMLSHIDHIGVSQGFGQLYMIGKNLPKTVVTGVNHCLQLTQEEGEPDPQVGYLDSNPPLEALAKQIEMKVALMLTTNNLSTSGFSTTLQGGKDFASGVALMIDKTESVEDVGEQAKKFIKAEPETFSILSAWHGAYKGRNLLTEEWAAVKMPPPDKLKKMQAAFPSPKPVVSEKEQLEVIEKRKELGLNTEVELLMRDDPSLTEEEAKAKLEKIKAEKQANMESAATAIGSLGDGEDGDEGTPPEDGNNPNANQGEARDG